MKRCTFEGYKLRRNSYGDLTALFVFVCLLLNFKHVNLAKIFENSTTSPPLQTIQEIFDQIFNIRFNINKLAPNVNSTYLATSFAELNQIISTKLNQNPVLDSINYSNVEALTESLFVTLNLVITKISFTNYTQSEISQTSTSIFKIYQIYSRFMNYKFKQFNESSIYQYQPKVQFKSTRFSTKSDKLIEFQFEDINLKLPIKSLPNLIETNITASAIVTYSFANYLNSDAFEANSAIISITIENYKNIELSDKYKLIYKVNNQLNKSENLKCAFWDDSRFSWSTSGCQLNKANSSSTISVCECNHLTDFAVLHDLSTVPIDSTTTTTSTIPNINSTNPIDEISSKIENLLETILSQPQINQQNWLVSLQNISILVTTLLDEEVLSQLNISTASALTNSSLAILDLLIEPEYIWENLTESAKFNSSSIIFKTIGNLLSLMNAKQNESIAVFDFKNIQFHSALFETKQNISFNFDEVFLELPIEALNNSDSVFDLNKNIAASATVLKKMSSFLSFEETVVNSHIISIKIENYETISFNGSHRLKFITKNLERLQFGDQPHCAFWSYPLTNFSTSGCTYNRIDSNRSTTTCECDHLTDFLTITDISNREVPSVAKSVLTYICSSISCLFLIWSVYISVKYNRENFTLSEDQFNVKSNRYYLSLSIAIWLFVSHMLIMFGLDRTEVQVICDLNSVILLFSLLTTFSFMFMFSFHLYISTSQSHLFRYFPFKYFAIFAYVFPLTIILFSFIIIWASETKSFIGLLNSLAGEYFCWLSSNKYPYHIWIFVGPVTLIIVANSFILFSIIYTILRNRKQKPLTKRTYGNLLTAYILMFNFGIPWILYVFYINEKMAHIFSYIFIVVNGTQGIALFAEQFILYRMKMKRIIRNQRNASDSSKLTFLSFKSK